jgi:radical SAM protein with 4Fe4S-binding SPASM domain
MKNWPKHCGRALVRCSIDMPQDPPRLARVYLAVTHRCPLRCRHCYAASTPPAGPEFTLREIEKLVQEMAALNVFELTLTGGEPFARADILDIIRLCLGWGMRLTVLTSGMMDASLLQKVKRLPVELRLSLDGVSEETHDYIRGKGNLGEVVRIVRELRTGGTSRLSAHFTVNRLNLREICKVPYFLHQLGIRDLVVSMIKPAGRACEHPELLVEPELLPLARERMSTISKSPALSLRRYTEQSWSGLACPAAFTKCGITPEGNITPCVFLGDRYIGGSIREHSLEQLWRDDETCRMLRCLRGSEECLHCSQFATRHGGCRARALYYRGSIEDTDPYCCALRDSRADESFYRPEGRVPVSRNVS